MKKTKLSVLVLLIFLLCSSFCFASVSYRPGVSVSGGLSLGFPTADYLKNESVNLAPVWVQGQAKLDFDILALKVDDFSFGFGASAGYTTKSFHYGSFLLKDYLNFGVSVFASYKLNSEWEVGLRNRLLCCWFMPFEIFFGEVDVEPYGEWLLAGSNHWDCKLLIPITICIRKDLVQVVPSVGFKVCFNSLSK